MKKNAKTNSLRKSRRRISNAALERLRKAAEREFDYKLDIDFYDALVAIHKLLDEQGQKTKDRKALNRANKCLLKAKKAADIARKKLARM